MPPEKAPNVSSGASKSSKAEAELKDSLAIPEQLHPPTECPGLHLRTLSLWDGISTIISLMVGSGIFTVTGATQEYLGSPGLVVLMMAISGLLALTGALWYSN